MHKYNQSAAEQYYGSFGHQLWFWSDCFFVTYLFLCPCPFGLHIYTSYDTSDANDSVSWINIHIYPGIYADFSIWIKYWLIKMPGYNFWIVHVTGYVLLNSCRTFLSSSGDCLNFERNIFINPLCFVLLKITRPK